MATQTGTSSKEGNSREFADLNQLFTGIAEFPAIVGLLRSQAKELCEIKCELADLIQRFHQIKNDGWLDAKAAAAYLGMSAGTFDKYRYLTIPKLKGYKVGGKVLYQRIDLDTFVKLFEVRSSGCA